MDILQTPARFYPYIGGVESYVHDLSRNITNMGHDITVVCANEDEQSSHQDVIDGIRVIRLNSFGKISKTNITPQLPQVLLNKAREVDLIHTHIPTPWSADFSALSALLTDTPLVITYHNDIIGKGLNKYVARLYNRTALKFTLNVADKIVITQPDYIRSSDHLQPYTHKVEVIHNGVDTKQYHPINFESDKIADLGLSPKRPNLFFLSVLDDLHEYKGLDILIESMSILKNKPGMTPRLVVGGDGELKSDYESLASDFGVSEYIRFVGHISDEDLIYTYNGSDVFVLPSLSSDQEGFGLVILEALSCGTPVVTTDVVGVSDDIKLHNLGTLAETGDPHSLANSIQIELETSNESKRRRARKICKQFYSWRSSAKDIVTTYKNLI